MSLTEKAMLVTLNMPVWEGRRVDRKVTAEVHTAHGLTGERGRFNKDLVARDALADIKRIVGQVRTAHYAMTLPWLDNGTRILSSQAFEKYAAMINKGRDEFTAARDTFVANYAAYVEQARADLNGLFNDADYPSPDAIAGRFRFERKFWPIPGGDDFRVNVGDADRDAIRAEIAANMQTAMRDAMRDAFERIIDKVGTMAEKLSSFRPSKGKGDATQGIFRDSLVENIKDLIDVLPGLNITGDAKLSASIAAMGELVRYDADALRQDAAIRRETAEKAAAIVKDLSEYIA